jgi:hypothetical protein
MRPAFLTAVALLVQLIAGCSTSQAPIAVDEASVLLHVQLNPSRYYGDWVTGAYREQDNYTITVTALGSPVPAIVGIALDSIACRDISRAWPLFAPLTVSYFDVLDVPLYGTRTVSIETDRGILQGMVTVPEAARLLAPQPGDTCSQNDTIPVCWAKTADWYALEIAAQDSAYRIVYDTLVFTDDTTYPFCVEGLSSAAFVSFLVSTINGVAPIPGTIANMEGSEMKGFLWSYGPGDTAGTSLAIVNVRR